ncbi:FAD:protein FMN transferase [Prosthecochloris sp. ZM_2]|uniref:FAD:protein FMN transferase n=1 Tax=Prosthecochloris sp. ZM_2 TaxID=2045206 RepID=UPI000DF82373|nr:FAD:protein FMN transferase [Prosthecochloris sp. ZM_2]RNA64791.1 FAD:protein FMN transferase [Prosthecochloris sp. ZM_2]
MLRRQRSYSLVFLVFFALAACSGGGDDLRIYEQQKIMMGTVMKIKAVPDGMSEEEVRNGFEAAFREMNDLESELSEWQPASPVSAVNRHAGGKAVEVPPSVITVTEKALDIASKSEGTFDVTFKPIGRLWDVKNRTVPPPADSVSAALDLVDYRHIRLDTLHNTLKLDRDGMEIGFGGIAKGYAAWRAGEVLRKNGIENFIINAGGDLYVSGKKGDRYWTSGIKNPDTDISVPVTTFNVIAPCGIATSGAYENYFMHDGRRYHHIIDLRTGYPAEGLKSVTVFSSDPAKADAYATAFFVLGTEKALTITRQDPSIACILIDRNDRVTRSENLADFIEEYAP